MTNIPCHSTSDEGSLPHQEQGQRTGINTKHSGMTRELGEDCQEPDVDNRSRNREARTARLQFFELSSHYEFRSSKRIQPVNVRFRASSVKADPWTARQRSGTMSIFHTDFHYVSGLCNWDMTIPIRATNKKVASGGSTIYTEYRYTQVVLQCTVKISRQIFLDYYFVPEFHVSGFAQSTASIKRGQVQWGGFEGEKVTLKRVQSQHKIPHSQRPPTQQAMVIMVHLNQLTSILEMRPVMLNTFIFFSKTKHLIQIPRLIQNSIAIKKSRNKKKDYTYVYSTMYEVVAQEPPVARHISQSGTTRPQKSEYIVRQIEKIGGPWGEKRKKQEKKKEEIPKGQGNQKNYEKNGN